MFLSPDGEPFWGGTYFPPEPRWAGRGSPRCCRGSRRPIAAIATRCRRTSRSCARRWKNWRPGSGRQHRSGPLRPRRRAPAARGRSAQWRHRHRAEISAMRHLRAALARLEAHPPIALSRRRNADADDDLPGRHLRPSGRRLRAVFSRCALAGAAFRKDALRQCRARRSVDPRLAGDPRPALCPARRRDDRLARTRDADR